MSEVMEDGTGIFSLLAFCEHHGETQALTVTREMRFAEIILCLQEKGISLSRGLTLHYEHPLEHFPVSIRSDDDVVHMFRVHELLKKHICKMGVGLDEPPLKRRGTVHEAVEGGSFRNNIVGNSEGVECVESNAPIASIIWGRSIKGVGQTFNDANHFRRVLKNYCISQKRKFKYERNDGDKIAAICGVNGCMWRIYASLHKLDQSFGIRRCNLEHTCGADGIAGRDNSKADACWIANYIKEKVRTDSNYKPKDAMIDLKKDFGLEVNYRKAWNGREIALREIHGNDYDSFNKLRWFCDAVKESNPGSVADLDVSDEPRKFRRIFISFAACVVGFIRGCRPMLFLDGTHIKSKWKGIILTAVAKDADDGLITVAYAVVLAENDENWDWFCKKLKGAIYSITGEEQWDRYTIMSDRHPGLKKSIPLVFEGSKHTTCLRHLVENFKLQVCGIYSIRNCIAVL